jgi:glycerophosphoryl diester phosphodiesterase
MADGVSLHLPGHRIALKWHRLSRRRADPVFTGKRLAEGLALGASMEVDLRVHGGGGLVVLHEASLEHETTGVGPVASASAEYLRGLHIRDGSGGATANPVLLLEDLAALVRRRLPTAALVQLDFKDTLDRLTPATVAAFAAALAGIGGNFILSGGDWAAVKRLAEDVDGIRIGYDPCELPEAGRLTSPDDVANFVALVERIAPEANMIYLDYSLILRVRRLGSDIVEAFHRHGRTIDAWTLNTDHPNAAESLRALVACRVDQITTDEPIRLEEVFTEIGRTPPSGADS